MQKSKEWWSSSTKTHQRIIEPGPIPTIGALLCTDLKWMHCYCEHIGCGYTAPVALAPFAIRWGMDASTDLIRERLRCSKCSRKGVSLKRPSWNWRGYAVWPAPNGNSASQADVDATNREESK